MPNRATVHSLRRRNRAAVLRHIVLRQTTTRGEIASACDLSPSTATNVVADLMNEGLVRENGSMPSDGGRPITRICTKSSGAYLIGVDVGERGVTVELFDLSLTRVGRVFRSLRSRHASPARIAEVVVDAIASIRAANPHCESSLIGVGLGLPGIVDTEPDGDMTLFAQRLGWQPTRISDMFADIDLAIFADNGARTLAAAETWFGAARNVAHSVIALIGHGIGAGIISGGRVLRGSSSSAGEWGHIKISLDGPKCQCGARGCLEAYAGGGAIIRRWRTAGGTASGSEERVLTRLIEAADNGDPAAIRVIDETVSALSVGISNLISLFNPEQIVVGGWAGIRLFKARGEELTAEVRRHTLTRPGQQCRFDPCHFGDDAVALGAALLPLEQLIEGTLATTKACA